MVLSSQVTSKPSTGASRLVEVKHRRWQSESIPGPSFRQSRGHGEQKPGNIMVLPSGKLT